MKLWKITVNNWAWDAPRTYYAGTREDAEKIARRFPAADRVTYAGTFREKKAAALLETTAERLGTNNRETRQPKLDPREELRRTREEYLQRQYAPYTPGTRRMY